jgi:hypothetical protein
MPYPAASNFYLAVTLIATPEILTDQFIDTIAVLQIISSSKKIIKPVNE